MAKKTEVSRWTSIMAKLDNQLETDKLAKAKKKMKITENAKERKNGKWWNYHSHWWIGKKMGVREDLGIPYSNQGGSEWEIL